MLIRSLVGRTRSLGAAPYRKEMSPVEPEGSRDVGESIHRKIGKGGGVSQCIRELPAKFVLELLKRNRGEAHTKGGGQLRERHDRVVGSEHATKDQINERSEGDSVAEGNDAGDLVVVTLDVAVRLVRHVKCRRELTRILPRSLARRPHDF